MTDSTGSVLVGATLNVIGNVGFLAMALVPIHLAFLRRAGAAESTSAVTAEAVKVA